MVVLHLLNRQVPRLRPVLRIRFQLPSSAFSKLNLHTAKRRRQAGDLYYSSLTVTNVDSALSDRDGGSFSTTRSSNQSPAAASRSFLNGQTLKDQTCRTSGRNADLPCKGDHARRRRYCGRDLRRVGAHGGGKRQR